MISLTFTPKIIFFDLDGTLIDHKENEIPSSTIFTLQELKKRGHILVIATGRPPCLFYNIEKMLNIDTYIASNGRYVRHKDQILLNDFISNEVVTRFVDDMTRKGIDVAFESEDDFVINRKSNPLASQFLNYFNLKEPKIEEDYHKKHDILQMVMFHDSKDFQRIAKKYPELDFNISCPYGIDINTKGGMKEIGVKIVTEHFGYDIKDTIAVGDGYNDISMIKMAGLGIAMGNACEPLKEVADFVTAACHDQGVYKAFKDLKMI